MPDKPSKIGTSISILGWIVALCSLILNYINYLDAQKAREKTEKQDPIYSAKVSTYDPSILPADILKVTEPIKHEFTIAHQSGRPIIDLVATFATKDAEIISIELIEGVSGTTNNVDPSKHEASLRKSELLPTQKIKGYLITKGISKVSLASGAKEGSIAASIDSKDNVASSSTYQLWYIVAFLAFMLMIALSLVHLSIKHMSRLGVDLKTEHESVPLLLLLLILGLVPSFLGALTLSEFFYGFMVYFLITRFKIINTALEQLAKYQVKDNPTQPEYYI